MPIYNHYKVTIAFIETLLTRIYIHKICQKKQKFIWTGNEQISNFLLLPCTYNFGRVHLSTIHRFTYGTYQQLYRETQCLFCVFVTSVILMLGVTFECYCSLYRTTRTAVSIVFYILRCTWYVPQNNQAFFLLLYQ